MSNCMDKLIYSKIYNNLKECSKLLIMILIIFGPTSLKLNAQTAYIGTGTSTQSYPFNALWGHSRSVSIYSSSELQNFGSISTLGWYVGTAHSTPIPIKIYLLETSSVLLTTESCTDLSSEATLVYDNTVVFCSEGLHTIDITDFNYSENNLMVICEANFGGTGTSQYPVFTYSESKNHLSLKKDHVNPTKEGCTNSFRPNIKIEIIPYSQETNLENPYHISIGEEDTSDSKEGRETISTNLNYHPIGNIYVYPNPFNNSIIVETSSTGIIPDKIDIVDLLGNVIFSYYPEENHNSEICLDLDENRKSGYYLLRVFFENNIVTTKVFKE